MESKEELSSSTLSRSDSKVIEKSDSKVYSVKSGKLRPVYSSRESIKGKKIRRRRRKQISIISEEADEDYEYGSIRYDEYRPDFKAYRWEPPKPQRYPRISTLLEEWMASQPEVLEDATMTKKARKAQEREQAALMAKEAERLKAQLIKDILEEIRLEKQKQVDEVIIEEEQAQMREVQLEKTQSVINKNMTTFDEYVIAAEEEETWMRYMTCDGLPDPGTLSDMNTFIFVWTMEDEEASMMTIAKKCETVVFLLMKLDEIIHYTLTKGSDYIKECIMIRNQLRKKLKEWIDMASYSLLRQIERDMIREDMKTARFVNVSPLIISCIWALIKLPIGLKEIPERDRKPVEITFEELHLTIKMPMDITCYCMAIRGLWLNFDHFSDGGISFHMPEIPEEFRTTLDIITHCRQEYEARKKIREEQVEGRKQRIEEKQTYLRRIQKPPDSSRDRRGKQAKKAQGKKKDEPVPELEPLPYLPTPEEVILMREDDIKKKVRKHLFTRCEKTEINLRKYRILGGIYSIDLLYQPPQPKDMRRDIFLSTLQIPKLLKHVPFEKTYKPPPRVPEHERTPEVVEAEMKALEAAMEALVLITLKLPDTVLWFEPPSVAHWIPERRVWSTQDIHDIKYNEEKQTIAFRTGRLGIHGLAALRFINLPFQSWELKPEMGKNSQGGVVLSITAAMIQAEFIVREDNVSLHSLVGGPNTALQNITGQYMKIHFLIEKMRDAGCDLFPERDAHSYIEGLPVKHPAAEKHLQKCMGLLCTAYSFAWSRWNASRSPREIVMQFKELHGCVAKERTNLLLLVTPPQTMALQCTEVSSEFSTTPFNDDTKFYADLYNFALHNAGIKSRMLMESVSFKLALTVTHLLERTNVISVSS